MPGLEDGFPLFNPRKRHPPATSPRLVSSSSGVSKGSCAAASDAHSSAAHFLPSPGSRSVCAQPGWGHTCLYPEPQGLVCLAWLAGWLAGREVSGSLGGLGAFRKGSRGTHPSLSSWASGMWPVLPPRLSCLGPGQPPLAPCKQTKFFGCL